MEIRKTVQAYLESTRHLRPLTQDGYKRRLEVFCDWCEGQQLQLEDIKKAVVDLFIDHLRTTHRSHYVRKPELSTATLAGYATCIIGFLRWCVEEEEYEPYVKASNVKKIKKPKIVKTIIETFNKAQLQNLFLACEREFDEHLRRRDRVILSLLLDTGIRANELCTLTLDCCFLDAGDAYIKVFGKGQKWREVGLGTQSRQSIERYLQVYRSDAKPTDPVFINRYHQALTVWGLEQIVTRLGEWAHVEGVRCSPHTFRHTYAVQYLLNGGDVFKLSLLMGHENVETTQVYLRTMHSRMARRGQSVFDSLGLQ